MNPKNQVWILPEGNKRITKDDDMNARVTFEAIVLSHSQSNTPTTEHKPTKKLMCSDVLVVLTVHWGDIS